MVGCVPVPRAKAAFARQFLGYTGFSAAGFAGAAEVIDFEVVQQGARE
jgi:hypothetical protein